VSAPCTWEEVEAGTVGPHRSRCDHADRIAKVGDLWSDMRRRGRSLTQTDGKR
jgi:DNA primase